MAKKWCVGYGDTTDYPRSTIADTASLHGLIQIIDKPTNFEPHKTPSCIDLNFSSQPSLIWNTCVSSLN